MNCRPTQNSRNKVPILKSELRTPTPTEFQPVLDRMLTQVVVAIPYTVNK